MSKGHAQTHVAGAVHQFFLHIWVLFSQAPRYAPSHLSSLCTVEGDVTPSTDTEGSPASPDGETKGGQPLRSRSWPTIWAVQSQPSGEPSSQPLLLPWFPTWSSPGPQSGLPWACVHIYSGFLPGILSDWAGNPSLPSRDGCLPLPTVCGPVQANRLARLNSKGEGCLSLNHPGSPSSVQGPQAHSTLLPPLLHSLQHGHKPCPPGRATLCLSSQGD